MIMKLMATIRIGTDMNAWNWTVFNLMVDTVILAEMKEAESDIYTTGAPDA
jgi:hypothetical protein